MPYARWRLSSDQAASAEALRGQKGNSAVTFRPCRSRCDRLSDVLGFVITTCPRCFSAEEVTWQRLPDRTVLYTCDRRHGGEGPHTWLKSLDQLALHEEAAEGVTDELLEPLGSCVLAGEPFVEYGVVEYRFRQRFPDWSDSTSWSAATGCSGPRRTPLPASASALRWHG